MSIKPSSLILVLLLAISLTYPSTSSAQIFGSFGKKKKTPKAAVVPKKVKDIEDAKAKSDVTFVDPPTEEPASADPSSVAATNLNPTNRGLILDTFEDTPKKVIKKSTLQIPEKREYLPDIPPDIEKKVSVTFVEDKKNNPPPVETYPMKDPTPPKAPTPAPKPSSPVGDLAGSGEYGIGIDDLIEISVLKPEAIDNQATVAPDGTITFPYIGTVQVKGRSIKQVQDEIQQRLSDGYMKYPVVIVSLKESRSRKFFVYGEVVKPGSYPMEDNMTVLRAISTAGGFTRFGSSSRVKVLRPKKDSAGYDTIKVNINAVMSGNPTEDIQLSQGDIVVISQGVF